MKHALLLAIALTGVALLPAVAQEKPAAPVAPRPGKPVHRPLIELFTSQG
jgi:hypothetical protein